jgi:valyl-tRNA synthetase
VKSRLETAGDDREVARAVLVHTFDRALKLLHPAVPFITEVLWQKLPGRGAGEFLAVAEWPRGREAEEPKAAREFELVREAVLVIRQIRGDNAVPPGKSIEVLVRAAPEARDVFAREGTTIGRLTRSDVRAADGVQVGAAAHAVLGGGTELIVPLAGLIDVEKECARLRGEVSELEKQIASREGRLSNAKYVERAPANVVANDRAILDEMKTKRGQLVDKVRSLCGA